MIEGEVVQTHIERRSFSLAGYRADGSPTYAGQAVGCALGFRLEGDRLVYDRTWVSV